MSKFETRLRASLALSFSLLCLLAWSAPAFADAEYRYCARDNYGRGAGVPVSTCASGLEQDGALCYPGCSSGYDGVGPVCWQVCPSGYTDDGAFCRKDAIIISQVSYGRGAGTIPDQCPAGKTKIGALCYDYCASGWNSEGVACTQPCNSGYRDDGLTCFRDSHIFAKDSSSCPWYNLCCAGCPSGYTDDGCFCRRDAHAYTQPRYERGPSTADQCPGGKENQNGLCYTPCAGGYVGEGPVCWQNCPSGYIDDGVTCRKPEHIFAKSSYGRGAGEALGCTASQELDGALCYPFCGSGYDGVGPVCWEGCPSDYPADCGTGCATTSDDCAAGTLSLVPGPSCTEPASATACNGSAALCGKRFDEVTFGMTHNAHAVLGGGAGIGVGVANQTKAVYAQMREGIRGMMIDVGLHDGEVWLCHGGCDITRFVRLSDYLVTLRRFLDANPSETLTLLIEHTDGVSSQDVSNVFQATGLDQRTYVKPNCAAWPTLSQLGGKIVVFSQNSSAGVVQRLWSQGYDNSWEYDIIDGFPLPASCQAGRGTSSGLFVMNHFVTPPSSGITGSYSNGDRLLDHVDGCEDDPGKTPNFISLDYYEQGSFNGGSFADYVAEINAGPRVGRVWDQGCAPYDKPLGASCSLDGDCTSQVCHQGICVDHYCGDGNVDPDEGCDDGNSVDTDACTNACNPATCGDGITGPGEGCDDANANNADACTNGCAVGVCGDGIVRPDVEECDDANLAGGDCCSATCTHEAAGSTCEDGDVCTVDDSCDGAGVCDAGAPLDCDDGNVCTADSCSDGCVYNHVDGGCDDGNVCTVDDVCAGGVCVAGPDRDCDDQNVCTTDSCGEAGCENTNNTLACDDGDVCTVDDGCSDGVCVPGADRDCDDQNVCTTDACGAAGCANTNNTVACDDGDVCTVDDGCSEGVCVPGADRNCDDENVCTTDSCGATGCENANNTVACDDGDLCTQNDICAAGACQSGALMTCDDAEECTEDRCQSGVCVFLPRPAGTACTDDGDVCTVDACIAGSCTHPPAVVVCGDGNVCGTEACDDGATARADGCSAKCEREAVLDRDEQRCVAAVTKSGTALAKPQSRIVEACVRAAASEKDDAPATCMYVDQRDWIAKGEAKTDKQIAARCAAAPPFGLADPATVKLAAYSAMNDLVGDLFGDDLNAAVVSRNADRDASRCQLGILRAVHKLMPIEVKAFLACEKAGLAGKAEPQIISGADLERCMEAVVADAKGRFGKTVNKLAATVERICSTVSTDELFPGVCAGGADFAACIRQSVHCRTCQMFNALAGIRSDCDGLDDGASNLSCQ